MSYRIPLDKNKRAQLQNELIESEVKKFNGKIERYEKAKLVVINSEVSTTRGIIYYSAAYRGTACRTLWNYSFRSEKNRREYIEKRVSNSERAKQIIADRKAAKKTEIHSLRVGDILSSLWGYDQTNVDFYEVVEVKSPKTVVIREIAHSCVKTNGYMSEDVVPCPGHYVGKPMTKRASKDNYINLTSYSGASPWHGKPITETSYA